MPLKKSPQIDAIQEDNAAARLVKQPRFSIRKTDPERRHHHEDEKYRNEGGVGEATIP